MVLYKIYYGRYGQTIAIITSDNEYRCWLLYKWNTFGQEQKPKAHGYHNIYKLNRSISLVFYVCGKSFERQVGKNILYSQTICYPPKTEVLEPTEWYRCWMFFKPRCLQILNRLSREISCNCCMSWRRDYVSLKFGIVPERVVGPFHLTLAARRSILHMSTANNSCFSSLVA